MDLLPVLRHVLVDLRHELVELEAAQNDEGRAQHGPGDDLDCECHVLTSFRVALKRQRPPDVLRLGASGLDPRERPVSRGMRFAVYRLSPNGTFSGGPTSSPLLRRAYVRQ